MLTHTHTHACVHCMLTEKLIFFDVIIEDDDGETEPPEEVVPYQLSKEAVVLDMKVQDIRVMLGRKLGSCPLILSTHSFCVHAYM